MSDAMWSQLDSVVMTREGCGKMKLKWNPKAYLERELYVGLFSIILGIILLYAPDRNEDMYRIYPKIVFSGLIFMGVVMTFYALLIKGGNNIAKAKIHVFEILVLAIVLISRPLISSLGLYSSVFIVTLAISFLLQKDKTPKNIFKVVIFNIAMIVVLYCAFALFLKVNAPDALLF